MQTDAPAPASDEEIARLKAKIARLEGSDKWGCLREYAEDAKHHARLSYRFKNEADQAEAALASEKAAREAAEAERDEARARVKALEADLSAVADIVEAAPELNMGNYDHDQVAALNNAMIEATLLLRAALATGGGLSLAAQDVLSERRRQVEAEGWTPEHDDQHDKGEISDAAACYALYRPSLHEVYLPNRVWPWSLEWWKPKDRRRNLVKAGALILAEIERLDRAALTNGGSHG